MYFLVTALFLPAVKEGEQETLQGVVATKYNEDTFDRAELVYLSSEQLMSSKAECRGFELNPDGILLSSSPVRSVLDTTFIDYISQTITTKDQHPKDLTDVVLLGAEHGAVVVQNLKEVVENNADPNIISCATFKVSNSSFNIYAPYLNTDSQFRTFSLVDIATNKPYRFHLAVPKEKVDKFNSVRRYMTTLETPSSLASYTLFEVDAPLTGANCFLGEAFCNYLAYSVAYHAIGLEIFKNLMSTSVKEEPSAPPVKQQPRETPKKPVSNLAIISEYKHPRMPAVLAALNDKQALGELIQSSEEAYITYRHFYKIFSMSRNEDNSERDMLSVCVELRAQSQLAMLKYALELLSQRLYLNRVGRDGDTSGLIYKGGGVRGYSVKKSTW